MKKYFWLLGYSISLFMFSASNQSKFFNKTIQEEPKKLGLLSLKIACHTRKQLAFINHVNKNYYLAEDLKNYLKGLAYRNVGLYEKAWNSIKHLPHNNDDYKRIISSTLYDLRKVEEIVEVSQDINITKYLSHHQKQTLIEYTSNNCNSNIKKMLYNVFSKNGEEHFFTNNEDDFYKKDIFDNWDDFLSSFSIDTQHLNTKEEILQAIEWLDTVGNDQSEIGFILLLRRLEEKNSNLYSFAIEQVKEKIISVSKTNKQSFPEQIKFIRGTLDNNKNKLALELIIVAYKEGYRSKQLNELLMECLFKVDLSKRDIKGLRRLVDEGFLNLFSEDALILLSKSKAFYLLYQWVEFGKEQQLKQAISASKLMPTSRRESYHKMIIDQLVATESKLIMNEKTLKELGYNLSDYYNWKILKLRWYLENDKYSTLLSEINNNKKKEKLKLLLYFSKHCYENNWLLKSLELAEMAYKLIPKNPLVLRRLVSVHHRMGNIRERLQFLNQLNSISGKLFKQELEMARDEKSLLESNWSWQKNEGTIDCQDGILHVLNKSYPEINGYTVRSLEIIKNQKRIGLNPTVVTKLGWSYKTSNITSKNYIAIEKYDGIDYYRLFDKNNYMLNKVPMTTYFNSYANELSSLVKKIRPRIIHAASNFQNALPALTVARNYGIQSVYEVRGMWHYTQSSKTEGFEYSDRYHLQEKYELLCCELADKVISISESLKDHLIKLGIAERKITVIPNAVDINKFTPLEPNGDIIKKYDLEGKLVIGFIGSITEYEGLDYLLKAISILKKQVFNIKLLIVGDGPELPKLKHIAVELGIHRDVNFVGRVPHEEVKKYYSVIDIFPFPRTKDKVCELVTPLKPFEAMAMGKLVLVSDIPALKEMVTHNETGIVFESESVDSLVEAIKIGANTSTLAKNGFEWVREERDWNKLIYKYLDVYGGKEWIQMNTSTLL